jgi:hypothetical protein
MFEIFIALLFIVIILSICIITYYIEKYKWSKVIQFNKFKHDIKG